VGVSDGRLVGHAVDGRRRCQDRDRVDLIVLSRALIETVELPVELVGDAPGQSEADELVLL
jgi:hypothetical protein